VAFAAESFIGILIGSLVVLPFFVLALTSRCWPRISGALLIAVSIFPILKGYNVSSFVLLILCLPLFYSGIALLRMTLEDDQDPTSDRIGEKTVMS
jgi:hypothetical protein